MEYKDILIVEDDVSLMEVTCDFLKDNGFTVAACFSGSKALELIKNNSFRLIILDINLPDLIGFDVCSIIRRSSKVPIIFLSARISDTDKITGLDLGADDYISKPYSLKELLSRIKAQIRRTYDYDSTGTKTDFGSTGDINSPFCFDNAIVDFESRKVSVDGTQVDLTAKEFDLLAYLIRNRNRSITKETLYNKV
ncbi:MAG: response regulator transcription factor, partial [Bacillota bacterium]|nr:response regulator transcription factor [Bacillota bacterium]